MNLDTCNFNEEFFPTEGQCAQGEPNVWKCDKKTKVKNRPNDISMSYLL